jgi:hypothetical protein
MRLVATRGDQTLSFPLREGSTIIGRHPSCHISIPAKGVSRRHCQVYVDENSAILRDLGSANGTFVNGDRIVERTELHEGDRITLGNFDLRFEITEGEAAGGYYPESGATEDVIVEAETGPEPSEPAYAGQPGPEEAPPAPSDFPEAPQGDETPVDASFVPQEYEGQEPHEEGQGQAPPGQEGALVLSQGAQMQPQLVVRDGRWFLRDPRTGREVEISPKGAAEPTAVMGPEPAARRPNTRLLVAVIAAAAVLVVGFAVVFLKPPPETNGGPQVSIAAYNRVVDSAIEKIREDETEAALKLLDRAENARPNVGLARLVAQYVRLKKDTPLDEKFPWSQARNWLESIEDVGTASDQALAYVREQLNWIDREQTLIGLLNETRAQLQRDPTIENKLEVYRKLNEFPDGYIASAGAKAEAQRLRDEIAKYYLDNARRAQGGQGWGEAVSYYQKALPFVDAERKKQINSEIASCQQAAADQRNLQDGRAAVQNDNFAAARGVLNAIKPGSPYYDDAQALLKQIDSTVQQRTRTQRLNQARSLWKTGNAPEAIKLIEQHDLQEVAEIKTRYQEWQRLMGEAQDALDAREYEKAEQIFQQAAAVPAAADNAYAQQAKTRAQAIRGNFPQYALEFANEGFGLITTEPRQARQLLEKALRYDGTNDRAKKGLDTLHRIAAQRYNHARGLMDDRLYANALKVLEEAEARAEPGSELHNRIRKAMAECQRQVEDRP